MLADNPEPNPFLSLSLSTIFLNKTFKENINISFFFVLLLNDLKTKRVENSAAIDPSKAGAIVMQ